MRTMHAVSILLVLVCGGALMCGAHGLASLRGGQGEGATAAAWKPPIELHNPAATQDVFSVVLKATPREVAAGSGFRAKAAALVEVMEVTSTTSGVLDAKWQAGEVARAAFNDTIDEFGWAFLALSTNPSMGNAYQAVAAGFLEGHLTQSRIYQWAVNGDAVKPFSSRKVQFMRDNEAWIDAQAAAAAGERDPYWRQVVLLNMQNVALEMGYNASAPAQEQLQDMAIMAMSWANDWATIEAAFQQQDQQQDQQFAEGGNDSHDLGDHCSGFVRVLPGNQDIYFAHDTWSSFQSMMRIYKLYDMPYTLGADATKRVPSTRIIFPSYPGTLYSGDDFYLCSSGLAVMETTIGTFNMSSLALINPQSLMDWQRNMVANRLATSGSTWALTFAPHNSGTYNNQFMVLDYNLFSPGRPLANNTFWVLEQIPGMVRAHDLTDRLRQHGYFGSYNIPQFPDIAEASLVNQMVAQHGNWFSYNMTARAQIFRRNHTMVTDLKSMQAMMRYNNFEHDPLSWCDCSPPYSSENAIACRDDLNPATMTYPPGMGDYFGHRDHCAIDSKITSYALMKQMAALIISSPTYDQQPVFVWSESWLSNVSHVGLPDRWEFPWLDVSWMK